MVASTCYPQTDYISDLAVPLSCNDTSCVFPVLQQSSLLCNYVEEDVFAWNSTAGLLYNIFVTGMTPDSVGTYAFTVTDYPESSNNQCEDPLILTMNGSLVTGTTYSASDATMCGKSYWPEVWYAVTGTDQCMAATTCFANATNFRTNLSIQKSCKHFNCMKLATEIQELS